MRLVHDYTLFDGGGADWVAALAMACLLSASLAYLWRRRQRDAATYYPDLAWLRAIIYFSFGLLASWSLGVLQSLLSVPLISESQLQSPAWIGFTSIYLVVLWIGYVMLWPRGTFTDGRLPHPLSNLLYGLAWGLCHGQVFLCCWAVLEKTGLNSYWVAALTYLALSGYNFCYHQFFWDKKVSPPHNYEAWNLKKVQFCHAPNLLLGLAWLSLWGNFGLWLLLQTAALTLCVYAMRFPAWYDDYRGVAGATR
ncbi:MAG: hypothetical protein ABJ308_03755 [Halieaceae bacterium]